MINVILINSHSNWTFRTLNLPLYKVQHDQNGQPVSVSRDRMGSSTIENNHGILRLRWVCLGVEVGFNFLSERGKTGGIS